MTPRSPSGRQFNQDASGAKRAAADGPVFITDRGRPSHVLMTIVARRCAALHVPDPRPERDAFIAATAAVHDLTLVTRNVKGFRDAGVTLIDPWAHGRSGSG